MHQDAGEVGKAWQRWIFIAIYVLLALYVYNGRWLEGLLEIIRIPAIEYILVFVLAGIFWLMIKSCYPWSNNAWWI